MFQFTPKCCDALNNIATYHYQSLQKEPTQTFMALSKHLAEHPDLFPRILDELFRRVLFEDCTNQWPLSRPIFSIILVYQQAFNTIKEEMLANQLPDHRNDLIVAFDSLMKEISPSLDLRMRDKFTQNLALFKQEVKSWIC